MEDSHREPAQSPLSPLVVLLHFCFLIFIPKKRGNLFCDVSTAYGRFLSSRNSTAPTTIIAMMMPMTAGTKYRSAADCGIGVGGGVASGSCITVKADTACEHRLS
jgi:hypothetical protein